MHKHTREMIEDIRKLKVQGARNVAKAAASALVNESEHFKGADRNEYISCLLTTADALASTRPTEPMLRNYLRLMLLRVQEDENASVQQMKEMIKETKAKIMSEMKSAIAMIADFGSSLIKNGVVCYTHCHSSTVVSIFRKAYDDGKDFSVVVSETRPKYQGVKTANELSSYGIPATLIVDSAARLYIKKSDGVFVGADAVTASGNLLNKIGTAMIAHFANEYETSFYSAAELHKFDNLTRWGIPEPIEMRDPKEVYAGKKPGNLRVENRAFDLTPSRYITAYITEKGIIPPQSIIMLSKG